MCDNNYAGKENGSQDGIDLDDVHLDQAGKFFQVPSMQILRRVVLDKLAKFPPLTDLGIDAPDEQSFLQSSTGLQSFALCVSDFVSADVSISHPENYLLFVYNYY